MKLKNCLSPTAGDRAYEFIKEMIFQNQLVPNQKITYDYLVEKIKLSKTPIINALNRLAQEGFVILVPNRGFFVREVNREEILEFFKIREALETLSIEESINNYRPKILKEIEKAMLNHKKYDHSAPSRNRLALDALFHLKIAEMSGNINLVKLLKHLFETVYLRNRFEGLPSQRLVEAAMEHEMIYEALKKKNILEAKKQMINHLNAGKTAYSKIFQNVTGIYQKLKNIVPPTFP